MKHKIKKFKSLFAVFFLILQRDGLLILCKRTFEKVFIDPVTDMGELIKDYIDARNMKRVVYKVDEKKVYCKDEQVDIIVCVHNALDDVRKCLDSVSKYSGNNYNLIIVDDGSDDDTRDFLADFTKKNEIELIRNKQALGYTYAANIGLRNSSGAYVVLLNSDTIVTTDWLKKMLCCAQSDSNIGLVGPLSNTASWQSVPKALENGDWPENLLPENVTLNQWAKMIGQDSGKVYPRIPFLNGFCLMIKRTTLDDLGFFDEENFGRGYGEENDFCLRAGKNGWSLAVADDAYVYHAQSKSYSNDKRRELSDLAGGILEKKHGKNIIQEGVEYCAKNILLEGIRARIGLLSKRFLQPITKKESIPKTKIEGSNYDLDLFRPRSRKTQIRKNVTRVLAFVRLDDSERFGSLLAVEILKIAKEKFKNKIDVVIFGLEEKTLCCSVLNMKFKYTNLGPLNSEQMSRLFNECDIFIDLSVSQTVGLAIMGAMASGLAVLLSKDGANALFTKDMVNALAVDASNRDACVNALFELIYNGNLRVAIGREAAIDILKFRSDFFIDKIE